MDANTSDLGCVLFDAVGTLIYPSPTVAAAYGAVGRKFGSSLNEAEIDRRFRQAFRRQEASDAAPNGLQTDEDREKRRWQTIVAEVFDDVADSAPLFDDLWMHFAQPNHWQLFDDAAGAWQSAAANGLSVGIASNFDGRLRRICAELPPLDRGRRIFVSSEIGARKPSPDFFRRIEESVHLSAAQILLVGDDWENDYLAAQAAGWQAVYLDRRGERPNGANVIRSLSELARRLS